MPRKKTPTLPDEGKVSEGVRIRTYPSGKQRLEIQFQYRGVQCRELLALPITRANTQYAINLKAGIEKAKAKNEFQYREFFPESPRCILFGEVEPHNPTVGEAVKTWLDDVEANHEYGTWLAYSKLARHCTRALGQYRVTDLEKNPDLIRNWIRQRRGTLKTIRNSLIPIRAILSQALDDSLIQRNPMDKIKVNKLANSRVESDYKVDPLSLADIQAFLKAATTYKPRWKNYFQFALFSGLRTSEIYALRWRDVDFHRQQVRVSHAVVERREKDKPKTKAGLRRVDLLPMALAALVDEYNATPSQGKGREVHDHVFWNPTTKKPITDYEHSGRAWKYILDKAGLRYRNQYQTRHSYCSNLLSGGENIHYVAQQMGHADIEMIMKTYGKWIEQGQEGQVAQRQFVSAFGQFGIDTQGS